VKARATARVTMTAPATSRAEGLSEPVAQAMPWAMSGIEPTITIDLSTPMRLRARAKSA